MPTDAKTSSRFSPTFTAMPEPMDRPARARFSRPGSVRKCFSTNGTMSLDDGPSRWRRIPERRRPSPRPEAAPCADRRGPATRVSFQYAFGITTIMGLAFPCAIRLSMITLAMPMVGHASSSPPLP